MNKNRALEKEKNSLTLRDRDRIFDRDGGIQTEKIERQKAYRQA